MLGGSAAAGVAVAGVVAAVLIVAAVVALVVARRRKGTMITASPVTDVEAGARAVPLHAIGHDYRNPVGLSFFSPHLPPHVFILTFAIA